MTMRDVAERAGVSVGTVSNALNRPDLLAEGTLQRVQEAIGLVVLDIDNPFFTGVARGVEAAASAADHLVILCNSASDSVREDRELRLLEEQRVAGVLMTPVGRLSKLYHQVCKRGTPIVLVDRRSSRRDQCSVAVDDVKGGQLAARHLIELGHTRIGLINGPHEITQCADRRAGFLAVLAQAGLKLRAGDDIEVETMTIDAGEAAAKEVLGMRQHPTAIFCTNDLIALGAEHTLLTAGCRVPDDVAVVGYDDVPFAGMAFVPLTSIRQPAYELGYRAAELLLAEVSGAPHTHDRVVFTPSLVARQSTLGDAAPPPAEADGAVTTV